MSKHPARPVKASAVIDASPEAVFQLIVDTRNDPLWCPNVETVDLVEGNGHEVGSRYRFHQHLDRPGGKRVEFDVDTEIISLTENSVTWLITDRFQEREVSMTVKPHDKGTLVTQVTKASFHKDPGFVKWVYPIQARRVFKDQFRQLSSYFADGP